MKEFDEWNSKKKMAEQQDESATPYIHVREIWWTSVGINIGSEVDGKHESYERPVLIIKTINRKLFFGIPLTGTIKDIPYHVSIAYNNKNGAAVLSQLRVFSTKRLLRKMVRLNRHTFE